MLPSLSLYCLRSLADCGVFAMPCLRGGLECGEECHESGALTLSAALTREPGLFGAAVSNVPLTDMLRFQEFLLGQAWTGEYGLPEDSDTFDWLRSCSPYHSVEQRPYPATLFATAAGDTPVYPAHARKMAAQVQHATTRSVITLSTRRVTVSAHQPRLRPSRHSTGGGSSTRVWVSNRRCSSG